MAQDSEGLGSFVFANPTGILIKGDIKDPMEGVLDAPVLPDCLGEPYPLCWQGRQKIPRLDLDRVPYFTPCLNHPYAVQVGPRRLGAKPRNLRRDPIPTRFNAAMIAIDRFVISARPKVFWYTTFLCNSQTIRYVKSISRSMIVRYVRPLTEQQRALLESTMKNDASHRARMRAHGLLLSSEGITIKAIAKIYHVDRDTVATWIKKWEKYGAKSLHDQPRSGRPTTLNATEKELAKQYIKEEPRSLKHVAERLAQKTAKRLSISSLKRLAKKARLRWKRVRKSLKSLRDPLDFAKCKRELEA